MQSQEVPAEDFFKDIPRITMARGLIGGRALSLFRLQHDRRRLSSKTLQLIVLSDFGDGFFKNTARSDA